MSNGSAPRRIGFGLAAVGLVAGAVALAGHGAGAAVLGDHGTASTQAAGGVAVPVARPHRVTVTNLGALDGACCSEARAVNGSGQVAGTSSSEPLPYGDHRAFLVTNGRLRALDWIGGSQASAAAINGAGDVVGNSTIAADNLHSHAALWRAGRVVDLGAPGGLDSFATDINDRGQVIGAVHTAAGLRAFVWQHGRMTMLATPAGFDSIATAVNADGVIVGSLAAPDNVPVRWAAPGAAPARLPVPAVQIPPGGGIDARAVDVNAAGQVLIQVTGAGEGTYLLTGTDLRPVPAPAGTTSFTGSALNDRGDIAGTVDSTAVLWRGGRFSTLPDLVPAAAARGLGLNNSGLVVGAAGTRAPDGGETAPVLWR